MSLLDLTKRLVAERSGNAATEMALVTPILVALMFGSAEMGKYILDHHGLTKGARDGARYASRLTLSASYNCSSGTIFEDPNATTKIINVTKTGSVDGTATGRFATAFWQACIPNAQPVTVTVRCVPKASYAGVYTGLSGEIPVVKVSANVAYPSLYGNLGFPSANLCLQAESETAVIGI